MIDIKELTIPAEATIESHKDKNMTPEIALPIILTAIAEQLKRIADVIVAKDTVITGDDIDHALDVVADIMVNETLNPDNDTP